MSFNHYRLRRQAHTVTRAGTDETWNPFRHTTWQRPHRTTSWNEGRAESQDQVPARPHSASGGVTQTPRASDDRNSNQRPVVDTELSHAVAQEPSEEGHVPGLRNRKPSAIIVAEPASTVVSEENIRWGFFRSVRPKTPFTVYNQVQRTLLRSWLNVLLFLVPVGIALHAVTGDSVETFAVNFLATIPLQFLAEQGLDEIQLRLGKTFASLLYISTSNLVQLISSILLLVNKETVVLQTTLIGGILANILLILGLSFFAGGLRRQEQFYNTTTAHVSSNLLSLAATSLLIPTASKLLGQTSPDNLAKQSRGAAVILIVVYILFLVYQLKTHHEVFSEASQKVPARPWKTSVEPSAVRQALVLPSSSLLAHATPDSGQTVLLNAMQRNAEKVEVEEDDDEEATPELAFLIAVMLFLVANVLLYFVVDYVVNSINALAVSAHLSRTFIGLILLPIPNCDLGAIHFAIKDDVDLVITYTIGKCLQTALCITPFIVLLAWWLGIAGVTLVFDGFEIVSLFAAILLLNFVVAPGKDSWIQGALLLADWALIAIAAYFVDIGPYGTETS